jgi:uncharacterized protein YwqG
MVANAPPESEKDAIWLLFVVKEDGWSRTTFPKEVEILAIECPSDDRLSVTVRFAPQCASALKLTNPTIKASLAVSDLDNLPQPGKGKKCLEAFCALLSSAGVDQGLIGSIANERRTELSKLELEEQKRTKREHARILRKYPERDLKELGALGPRLRKAIKSAGLESCSKDLVRFARPCVAIVETDSKKDAPVGKSRIGGLPDLPPDVDWPEIEGELLSFILQINLKDVPGEVSGGLLPSKGLLSLFVGRNDSTSDVEHRVLFFDAAKLDRKDVPDDASFRDEDTGLVEPVAVRLRTALSLPGYDSKELEVLQARHRSLEEDIEAYLGLQQSLCPADPVSYMFSYPAGSDDLDETASANKDDAVVLFRVDSHLSVGLSWWDAGELSIVVPKKAVQNRSFARSSAWIATS